MTQEGSIVQVDPDHERFGCALVIVTEKYDWGIQGFLMTPGNEAEGLTTWKGRAYVRLKTLEYTYAGEVPFYNKMKDDL